MVHPLELAIPNSGFTLEFEVEDTGIGIAPIDLETLFDAFVQSHHRTVQSEGTGLGLPISQKFIDLMGGQITVESALGQGTLCRFHIPIYPPQAIDTLPRPCRQRAIALAPDQPCYRILVVDDHIASRRLLVSLLRMIGFEVQEAIDGETGIQQWQQWLPHLIWMDIRMPILDGYAATQEIRRLEAEIPTFSDLGLRLIKLIYLPLLNEIPDGHASLVQRLKTWVIDDQFDQLLHLTQRYLSTPSHTSSL